MSHLQRRVAPELGRRNELPSRIARGPRLSSSPMSGSRLHGREHNKGRDDPGMGNMRAKEARDSTGLSSAQV